MKINVNGKSYEVEVVGNDVKVDGNRIDLRRKGDELVIGKDRFFLDYFEEGEPSLFIISGMSYLVSKTLQEGSLVREVRAPINGQITEVLAVQGGSVSKGQPLVLLEAMKMENQIRSPSRGKIKEVRVKKGQMVKVGQVLLTLD